MTMNMWGNETTGEVVEVGWNPNATVPGRTRPGAYTATQVRGPDDKKPLGLLCIVGHHAGMSEFWRKHRAESKGRFVQLTLHKFADTPVVTELGDSFQGEELPYTDSSDGRHRT